MDGQKNTLNQQYNQPSFEIGDLVIVNDKAGSASIVHKGAIGYYRGKDGHGLSLVKFISRKNKFPDKHEPVLFARTKWLDLCYQLIFTFEDIK